MQLIDGKKIAKNLLNALALEIKAQGGRPPGLAFILVGSHPASKVYVSAKDKACRQIGMTSWLCALPAEVSEAELLFEIQKLNLDPKIDGILVQLPLPTSFDERKITAAIDPAKDVDGFHPLNLGKLLLADPTGFIPCTPKGICTLLEKEQIVVDGRHIVILGRSHIVGKPLAALLMQKRAGGNATVTIAHSHTKDLPDVTRTADILIAAMGQPKKIKEDMIKPGAVVIDVGISRIGNNELVGDVDFERVFQKASRITPVPGGVGPMTIASLLENTWTSYKRRL